MEQGDYKTIKIPFDLYNAMTKTVGIDESYASFVAYCVRKELKRLSRLP